MAQDFIRVSPFIGQFITYAFIFSTIYGLYYYWAMGAQIQMGVSGMGDDPNNPSGLSVLGLLNAVLEFISWLSPFALVKLIVGAIMTPDLYLFMNMFVLRPVGWIVAIITADMIISRVPTVSSG